ncbi:MAG: ABC transporter ATP-binding protein [Pseudomonadota bacterium]
MRNRSDLERSAVKIDGVTKRYGDGPGAVTALDNVTLDIRDNEFFTLLGPSGCGKTTLLRSIAGFEQITEGLIFLFGEEIEDLPPNKRPINTVFQQYALFPKMTVAENIAFGLQRLKRSKSDVETRVHDVLNLVQLTDLRDRRPSQLSGGQQQRVALARALAPEPKVLLLDEPLSALDLKLRQAMRVELKRIQEETGITFIFVTHDQEEALTMSDRIAVMSVGQVQQIGTAHEIYERPRNRFVADFIGETNLFDVIIEKLSDTNALCRLPDEQTIQAIPAGQVTEGRPGHVSIRPEQLSMQAPDQAALMTGTVERLIYLGTDVQHIVRLPDGQEVVVRTQNGPAQRHDFKPGDGVGLTINDGAARLLVD